MRKCQFILVIFLLFFQDLASQRNNIWYFGRKAGLNFNAVPNQPIPSVLNNSAMMADEGCSSVTDTDGNLLFYSNGITVYNRNHQVMQNGDGLAGNISTVQSSLIVPWPGSDSLYYIFTADAIENNYANGYCYSIIDIEADNGNGQVISKNIPLWGPGTERMTAVRHADGLAVWLITNDNNSNIFRSWLITCSGLQSNAVTSIAGVVLDQHFTVNTGMMKVSPDGKQLCQTHFPIFSETGIIPNFIQLFDFDNATGIISNGRSIGFPDAQYLTCEYSPDSKLLYLCRPYQKAIDQLEVTLPSLAAITASRVSFSTGTAGFIGIQLAPDEKIYLSQASFFLGAINQPNVKGTGCNLQVNQIGLLPGYGYLGLPAYINDLTSSSPNNGFSYTILDSCSGKVQFNGATTMSGTLQWQWDFGDGSFSNLQNPLHTFIPSNQVYTVKIKITSSLFCGRIQTSKTLKPKGLVSEAGFDMVNVCDSGYVRFVNKTSYLQDFTGQFTWEFGDGNTSTDINPVHVYNQPGIYTVKLKLNTSTACLNDSATRVLDLAGFIIQAPPDQTILVGETVSLYVSGGGVSFQWTPSTGLSNPSIKTPQAMPLDDITYKVVAIDRDGCKSEDSVFVKVLPLDDIYVPNAFTPNNDGRNDVIRPWYSAKFLLTEFSIYNRWGQQVFTTRQRGAGWDGRINGVIQLTAVYVWLVRATDSNGKHYERKGSFTLIR